MNIVKDGDVIVVWFSCGAASAIAAKKTLEKYKDRCTIRIVNNPIMEEDIDNRRFLADVESWIDHPIEFATNMNFPTFSAMAVWEKRKYMSGVRGAPCTLELKKKARQQWEQANHFDHTVLGFTADEQHRHNRFVLTERALLPVLIEENISKSDCFNMIKEAGIKLPHIYDLGYPNANCIGCVKSTSVSYWNHVRQQHPEVFNARMEQSERLGARLVIYKGKRILLKELPPDAKGKPIKNMNYECGIFCEERLDA